MAFLKSLRLPGRTAAAAALLLGAAAAQAALPSFYTGQGANVVVGQADMTSSQANQGGSQPSASTLRSPIGVFSLGGKLYVADTSNNRVLVYPSTPTADDAAASLALGQSDLVSATHNVAQNNTLFGPAGVYSDGTRLFVADYSNNRVLIFNSLPSASGAAADVVVGQPDMFSNSPNQARSQPGADTLNGPTGVYSDGVKLYVADQGNNRVLVFNQIPASDGASADFALGQITLSSNTANQGASVSSMTMSSPSSVFSDGTRLFVSDFGNNRVLIFNTVPVSTDAAADVEVGQPDMISSSAVAASAASLDEPYASYSDGTSLFVADYGDNRVLVYNAIPVADGAAADAALGQPDLASSAANQGASVSSATLSGPDGVFSDGTQLYVSDYGNNRVLQFGLQAPSSLAFQPLGVSSAAWSWPSVPGATAYDFYPSTGGPAIVVTAASLTQTDLSTNTAYGGRVAAAGPSGQSPLTASVSGYTLAAPATGFAVVSVASSAVTLSWTAQGDPGGTRYAAEVSTDASFGVAVTTLTVTSLSASFSGLAAASTYYAQVYALNGDGLYAQAAGPLAVETSTPDAPGGLSGAGQSSASILWTWTAQAGVSGYEVYEATSPSTLLATSAAAAFTESGLSPNEPYGVQVRSFGPGGAGPLSASATAYTMAAAPTGLTASLVGYSSATLSWSDVVNPAGTLYEVEVSSTAGFAAGVATRTLSALTTAFTGLASGTAYTAQVYARSGDGLLTPAAAQAAFQTLAVAPLQPTLSATAISSDTLLWQWSAGSGVSQASSFELWASTGGALARLAAGTSSFAQEGLTPGSLESAYLEADNAAGSAFSSTETAATSALADFSAGTTSSGSITDPVTGLSGLDIPAGAVSAQAAWLESSDPKSDPLTAATVSLISQADGKLAGTGGAASSLREFVVTQNGARYTGTLLQPVTVTVPYPDADGDGRVDGTTIEAADLQLYTLDEQNGVWTPVSGSTVDTARKVVSASVPHLSIFTALGPTDAAASDLGSVRVYPNPWRPGSGGGHDGSDVVFDGLTSEATVRIFTMSGRLVRRLEKPLSSATAQALWDGTDQDGRQAASGVYYYVVTSPAGAKARGRLAVVR